MHPCTLLYRWFVAAFVMVLIAFIVLSGGLLMVPVNCPNTALFILAHLVGGSGQLLQHMHDLIAACKGVWGEAGPHLVVKSNKLLHYTHDSQLERVGVWGGKGLT